MEQRYYGYMPLYSIAQALLFRGAGLGVFQARFVSVVFATLTLALTYALGKRLFGTAVGLLAAAP
jgi:4-amino-4-deoxy-L-arabinose transferase-like glycosyltransferase